MKSQEKILRKKKTVKLTYWSYQNNPDNIALPMANLDGYLSQYWTNLTEVEEIPEAELESKTKYWIARINREIDEKLFIILPKNLYDKVVSILENNKKNFNINFEKVRDKRFCTSIVSHDNFVFILSGKALYGVDEIEVMKSRYPTKVSLYSYWSYGSFMKNLFFATTALTGGTDGRKEWNFWSNLKAKIRGLFFPLKYKLGLHNLHTLKQFVN